MKEIDLLKERNDKIDWFSLRNQAAMVNAAAILGNNEMITRIGLRSENDREDIHTTIAKCAIEHADSLINELQKPQFLKQGEQKPVNDTDEDIVEAVKDASILDMVEPKAKFHEGDWVIFAKNHNSVYQVERIDNYRYYLRHYLGGTLSLHFDNELVRLWTIQDAKGGDVLATKAGGIFIYKELLYDKPFAYCGVDKFGVFKDCNCGDGLDWTPYLSDVTPATKEQRDLLFQKMKEAGYEWNYEKKELNKNVCSYNPYKEVVESIAEMCKHYDNMDVCSLQDFYDNVKVKCKDAKEYDSLFLRNTWKPSDEQKTAWSEKDERERNHCIDFLNHPDMIKATPTIANNCKEWLKSLSPQSHWKPSDEQMKVLQWCMPLWVEPKSKAILESLINDLKKQMEE